MLGETNTGGMTTDGQQHNPYERASSQATAVVATLLGAALFGVGGALAGAVWPHGLVGVWLGGVLGWLAVIDARTHRLPNRIQYPAILALTASITLAGIFGTLGLRGALLGGTGVGVSLFLLAALGGGLGFGDVKLGVLLGLWSGWLEPSGPLLFLLAAFLLGGVWALGLLATRRATAHDRVAFGPLLIAGAVASTWLPLLAGLGG